MKRIITAAAAALLGLGLAVTAVAPAQAAPPTADVSLSVVSNTTTVDEFEVTNDGPTDVTVVVRYASENGWVWQAVVTVPANGGTCPIVFTDGGKAVVTVTDADTGKQLVRLRVS